MPRLLLLSNSTNFGSGYLDHAMPEVLDFLGPARRLVFVPFALRDVVGYAGRARARFAREGISVSALRKERSGSEDLASADAVFVGGGNTFRLLARLQRAGLVDSLRRRVLEGMPYMGASAGTNIAAPTIRTTNDMPIVEPATLDALGFVPFQINPHYIDPDPSSRHMGETREERLREFLEENDAPVLAMREGAWLRVEGEEMRLGGTAGARLFRDGVEPVELAPGSSIAAWLNTTG